MDNPTLLPRVQSYKHVLASMDGYVSHIECEKIGMAALVLGGGRRRKGDAIDPAVGLHVRAKLASHVAKNNPDKSIATIWYNDPSHVDEAEAMILKAYTIESEQVADQPLVLDTVV